MGVTSVQHQQHLHLFRSLLTRRRRRLHLGHRWKCNLLCTNSSAQPHHTCSISAWPQRREVVVKRGETENNRYCFFPAQADPGDSTRCLLNLSGPLCRSPIILTPQIPQQWLKPGIFFFVAGVSFCTSLSIPRRLKKAGEHRSSSSWCTGHVQNEDVFGGELLLTWLRKPRWKADRKMC